MRFYIPLEETFSTTDNNKTYTTKYYQTHKSITGVTNTIPPDYDSSKSYSIGEKAYIPELKRVYMSLENNNQGNFPPSEVKWKDWGSINEYKMFNLDEFIGECTTGTNVEITFDNNKFNYISLLNIEFEHLTVTQTDNNNVVILQKEYDGSIISASNWSDYWYFYKTKINTIQIPVKFRLNGEVKLNFTGNVKIGSLVMGQLEELGCALFGTAIHYKSESDIEIDPITKTRKVNRYGSVKILNVKVAYKKNEFKKLNNNAINMIDRNIVFIPSDDDLFSPLITLGYFDNLLIPIENPTSYETETNIIGVI